MEDKKPRILCVDDEPINLDLLEMMLEPEGYETITAKDGHEALAMLMQRDIDIVLLDVIMPVLNGFEVCKRIKGNERLRNIPVVMITALTSKEDRIKGIEAGAEDFISKPFEQAEVLARVRMLLKVKELNDGMNRAYSKINTLTLVGEGFIREFNPMNFEFMTGIDSIVAQILRRPGEASSEKPAFVIVRTHEHGKVYEWWGYEFGFDRLERSLFYPDISLELSDLKESEILFLNSISPEDSRLRSFVLNIKDITGHITNMVCYLSEAFCIFAINYGRKVTQFDAAVINNLVVQSLFLKSLSSQIKEVKSAFEYTVHALARAAEANDEDTGNHILRVGEYSAALAGKLGLSEEFQDTIRLQAQMHDVGKIHVSPAILKKPGKLTEEEYAEIKSHPLQGAKILGEHPRLAMAASIALTHHERWDGGGYPNRLKGEDIPLEGRIINIADQYDALRNKRVYKPAFDHETAFGIISKGDNRTMPSHFDPKVLSAFISTAPEFEGIYERLKG